jgi:hypothetical protein
MMQRARGLFVTGSSEASRAGEAARRGRHGLALAALLAGIVCALAPSVAAADGCPGVDDSYTGNCGPLFNVPAWTDAGGWNEPSQYSTIRLADLNGDGRDELIGRSDAGVHIYRFDTTLGQWRPQVDGNGVPTLLGEFATFLPSKESDPKNPNQAKFYSTIQAADIDGQPGAEILGRFWDGMRVYKYQPPAGGGIDGGSWAKIGTGGPFSDADGYDDPSLYSTIRVGQLVSGDPPYLFARAHGRAGEGFGRNVVFFKWDDGKWVSVPNADSPEADANSIFAFNDVDCGSPSCYLSLQRANVAPDALSQQGANGVVMGRTDNGGTTGVSLWNSMGGLKGYGGWAYFNQGSFSNFVLPPFGGVASPDCPFSKLGASGAGSGDCVGGSPSYYETVRAVDIDGAPGDEMIARASDGLRIDKWSPGQDDRLPTLTALAGAASNVPDGMWGSIRTGNIDGQGGDEVLFLDRNGNGLQAYSYDSAGRAWKQLPASPGLALGSDPWLSKPEYFSTIQVGDVDGDGRDDVIARGPYGIRTWFYDRRGTGGWERYLEQGYPDFPSAAQRTAFSDLTAAAIQNKDIPESASSVRDVWASENPPTTDDLNDLSGDLVRIGNCTGPSENEPVTYQACQLPASPSGPYTASDWTAVINEMLVEIHGAGQALAFLDGLKSMNQALFLQDALTLPAIGDNLGLQPAASNQGQFNSQALTASALGLAASFAGVIPGIGPELSAALWVASEYVSLLPQSSTTAASSFSTTYASLEDKLAKMVSDGASGADTMSYEVRRDASLLNLVGELRTSGPWSPENLDTIGIKSAANQAFAAWVYKALMPTVYDRYEITNCRQGTVSIYTLECVPPPPRPGVFHPQDFGLYVSTGQAWSQTNYPCYQGNVYTLECAYDRVPGNSSKVWGALSGNCSYNPAPPSDPTPPSGSGPETVWSFDKDCSAGVDVVSSVVENGWGFTSYSGSPDPPNAWCGILGIKYCVSQASASQLRSRGPIRLGRPRLGRRRAVRGRAQMRARIGTLGGMRLAGATVTLKRLLFEPGHGELTHPTRAQRPLKLRLSRVAAGRFAATTKGRRKVRLTVRRGPNRRASLTLLGARVFHTPAACLALPASVALESPPLWLQTRLVISDGRNRWPVRLSHHLRCRRDARGNVHRLEYVRHRRHRLRRGLAVTLRGPSSVRPGATARYVARVHNRRRTGDRIASSLWDVTLTGGRRTERIRELRRGRTRSFAFTVRVPRSAATAGAPGTRRGRFCVAVGAGAPGVRADGARVCSRVRAATARAPGVTG